MKVLFEKFCKEYHLDYNFKNLGYGYFSEETQKAYIIFKYSGNYRNDN